MEKQTDRNIMKAKGNAESCNLEMGDDPRHQYRLGSNCLGNNSTEKYLGVLKNTKLNVTQQCTLAARRPAASRHYY